MAQPKKLIEVAMPIKEISAESVRDKSIRHGHISTLHLWWARRPLPVCRAVVFASLVPDPLDENCPQAFKDAVEILLGSTKKPLNEQDIDPNAYKPYDDIPYTAAIDKMEDTPRNRLLMFIGKYSSEFSSNEKAGKITAAGKLLSDYSLIKWDNKNNEAIISKAQKLIWVGHNSEESKKTAKVLLNEFDQYYKAIKDAEKDLYSLTDRHIENEESKLRSQRLKSSIEGFLDKMPKVFDPFAGGGAIPLEAARLGCRSYGNDINPVAHIIQKVSLEFPQKYGKSITYSKGEFIKIYGQTEWNKLSNENLVISGGDAIAVKISNRLSFDVFYYANLLLQKSHKAINKYYPAKDSNKLVGYFWSYFAKCGNPTCRADVPLLRTFYLCDKKDKRIFLKPIVSGKKVDLVIKHGECLTEPFVQRKNLKCPCCGNITPINELKRQFKAKEPFKKIVAVIEEGQNQKVYRLPTNEENEILNSLPKNIEIPSELIAEGNSRDLHLTGWGPKKWGDMFSERQLLAMHSFIESLNEIKIELQDAGEYMVAVSTYLGIFINRLATRLTSFGLYNTTAETIEHPFGRQAIPFVFDFPEIYPFSNSGGGGLSQLDWIIRYIEGESSNPFQGYCRHSSSGDITQFETKSLNGVITDPPYYDAIAYADLSDFFYVWLKRSMGDLYPINFATPQTPKSEECTALKHHHSNDEKMAKKHFEKKLVEIFKVIEIQTNGIVSIMFAHQSTEAWTTLCNSILQSNMNITGSWAIDTERTSGTKVNKAFLSSSVTVSCLPLVRSGYGDYKEVKKAIERTVALEVTELYKLGFRGADLLTACFGQAVSEFGRYEKVEKADGSEVTVAELLEMARESAFNALLKGFDGDDFTKFYIGWLQLYGFSESDFDDAAKFSRVGLSVNVSDLFADNILIQNGNKQTLGSFEQRIHANKNLGERANNNVIDLVHKAMNLYKGSRSVLLQYINKVAAQPESSFWRVVTSLCEVLPNGTEDYKLAVGLITNKDSLIKESKSINKSTSEQAKLEF